MNRKKHQPIPNYVWDKVNDNRMGRYLTRTELQYVRYALLGLNVGRALDVGCATGRLSLPLMNMDFDVVGLDYDFQALQGFLKQDKEAGPVQASAEAIPFVNESFICLVAIQMIDYLRQRADFYREAHRLLKPEGVLLVALTNKHSLKGIIYETYLRWAGRKRIRHYYELDYKYGVAEVRTAGFKIIHTWGYNWNVLPRDADTILVDVFAEFERFFCLKNWPALSPSVFVVAKKVT